MSALATWVCTLLVVAALGPSGVRWLRVAQREHYLGGSVSRFAVRWWSLSAASIALVVLAFSATVVTWLAELGAISRSWIWVSVVVAVVISVGPLGLSLRGRTSKLHWTRRLKTLAGMWLALQGLVVLVGVVAGVPVGLGALALLSVPILVDVACWIAAPIELRLGAHFIDEAHARLLRVDPLVVAVTGSYGKTSTKGHIGHLVAPSRSIVATPASFNNRAGLARAINEHLADGTEVFVAEMGTYGVGEIAAMCAWCPPRISAITAIGPVHLERMGSEETILRAKSEITVGADHVVLNVDNSHLVGLANRLVAEGREVTRCSASDPTADVAVLASAEGSTVSLHVGGKQVAEGIPAVTGVQSTNLAIAVAIASLLGVDLADIEERLASLAPASHRLEPTQAASGATILDDTYNSNPAGASAAVDSMVATAESLGGTGRRVVVTPGMVELGHRQFEENEAFARNIAEVATDLLIVGRTNRAALRSGVAQATGSGIQVHEVATREDAVAWVREALGARDVVLYENDLPDHYP